MELPVEVNSSTHARWEFYIGISISMIVEEDTIAFASDLSKKACRGAGDKFEAFLM